MWALLQPKDKRGRLLLANVLGKHKASKRCPTRIEFDLEKLKDPQVPEREFKDLKHLPCSMHTTRGHTN